MIYSSVLPRGNVKKLPVFAVLARLPLGKLEEYNEEGLAHSGTFDFETDMPFFTHTIGPLLNDVTFRSLSLSTIEAPIHVESIYAERASIVTSNAPITGTFKSSKSLRLATQKAPIIINAILEGGASSPTALDVQTHQAPLAIATTLESPGSFSITSRTYNAPIQLTFPQSSSNVPDFHPSFVEAAPSNLRFDFTLHKSSSDVGPASFSGGSNAPDDDSNPGIGAHFSFNLKDGSKVDGMMAW
ncbi:hypothetical protein SISNIDRAFT_172919 [Sistotremastrum niveocremeum HHB9708]|nr:hypothetical protein SISNIDRAFT_172919 [Sistotremastrum niveocremeum HHB9708]